MAIRERLLSEGNVDSEMTGMKQPEWTDVINEPYMTTIDIGDNEWRLDTPSAYRMESRTQDEKTPPRQSEDPLLTRENKEDSRTERGPTIELREIQEETAQFILKLNDRPFPGEIIRMMSTFLDKAVEDESVAIYMSVVHEAKGDQDITLAFEGSLTKDKGSENIFPNQTRIWVHSTPVTIRITRRETDKGERICEIKDMSH